MFLVAVDGLGDNFTLISCNYRHGRRRAFHEHQLDEIATRVNVSRADGIAPESFLTPSFLKYFPVFIEPGVLTDVNWNNISGVFVWSPVLPMTYVDNDILMAMSK